MLLSVHFCTLAEGERFKQRLAQPYLPARLLAPALGQATFA